MSLEGWKVRGGDGETASDFVVIGILNKPPGERGDG